MPPQVPSGLITGPVGAGADVGTVADTGTDVDTGIVTDEEADEDDGEAEHVPKEG